METKLLEPFEALLKTEGFTRISRVSSTHSATISAQKGTQRVVMHVTDQQELPSHARRSENLPSPSDVRVTPRLPGLSPDAAGQILQRSGQGGALRKMDRIKRHT